MVHRPGRPPPQMLKEGGERRSRPFARERGIYLDKLFAGIPKFLVTSLLMGRSVIYLARACSRNQSAPANGFSLSLAITMSMASFRDLRFADNLLLSAIINTFRTAHQIRSSPATTSREIVLSSVAFFKLIFWHHKVATHSLKTNFSFLLRQWSWAQS